MSERKDFDPESMMLPPSREFAEAAALLAFAAAERRPPSRVKARVMASLRPAPAYFLAPSRWAIAAGAIAVLLLAAPYHGRARPELLDVRGSVTVDGHAASAGERLAPGRTIAVSGDGEAVVRIGGRAGFRLSHGAQAVIVRDGETVDVRLMKGWILSAVKTGTPYTVQTEHGSASALGTDFMVKEEQGWAQVCICRGRLRLDGFPKTEIAAEHHDAVSQPEFPGAAAEGQKGHTDAEIASLRALLRLDHAATPP